MPPLNPVDSLAQLCLNQLSHLLNRTCSDRAVSLDKIKKDVTPYFSSLPVKYLQAVYRTFLNTYKTVAQHNEKHVALGMYIRSDELYINAQLKTTCDFLRKVDKKYLLENNIKHFTIHDIPRYYKKNSLYDWNASLCITLQSLVNLSTLTIHGTCTNQMLQILYDNCTNLEKINLIGCPYVTDTGIVHLCGFKSLKVAKETLRWGCQPFKRPPHSKLKFVFLSAINLSMISIACLMRYCAHLETTNICPQFDIGGVFDMIYGDGAKVYDEDSSCTDEYGLTEFESYFLMEENHLNLLVRVCPNLTKIKLRFSGRKRVDKNLLANLGNGNITYLGVTDCNIDALVWYLKHNGSKLTTLDIKVMLSSLESAALTRSAMSKIIKYCFKLENLSVSVCGSPSIIPDVPMDTFRSHKSLKHLESIKFQGISLTPDDLEIFLWYTNNIKKIHISCQSLDLSIDHLIDELLANEKMKNIVYFYIAMPDAVLNFKLLRKIITYCPLLHEVGPLSLWNISKLEYVNFKKEITEKNWNLNVDSFPLL